MPQLIYFDNLTLTLLLKLLYAALLAGSAYLPLQVLQLGGYKNRNFWRQLKTADRYYTLKTLLLGGLPLLLLLSLNTFHIDLAGETAFLLSLVFVIVLIVLDKFRKKKTPLAFTPRIKRAGITLFLLLYFSSILTFDYAVILPSLVSFFAFVSINILKPLENNISKGYLRKCKKTLKKYPDLIKIGITGSSGKTSVKNILHAMLSKKYRAVSTPKSYNTPLGVTKCVLSEVNDKTEIFIAEMGARKKDDIWELCKLVEPDIGIITAIVPQHMETFLTIDNLIKTKFEMHKYLMESGGMCVVSGDNAYIEEYIEDKTYDNCYVVHCCDESSKFFASDLSMSEKGLVFTLHHRGNSYPCKSKLLGRYNLSNIMLAAFTALKLGVKPEDIATALSELAPVPHRLELIESNGLYILDDSYNSNPDGCGMALEVLSGFSGGKIILTPGLVEMGKQEAEQNQILGEKIAAVCDYAFFIGNRAKFLKVGAVSKGMREENIFLCGSLSEATEKLQTVVKSGDCVLFENDLPDNL